MQWQGEKAIKRSATAAERNIQGPRAARNARGPALVKDGPEYGRLWCSLVAPLPQLF
jgi:hypothetical protein